MLRALPHSMTQPQSPTAPPALQTAKPTLHPTHCTPGCPSPIMKQPSPSYRADHRWQPSTTCLYPCPSPTVTASSHQMAQMMMILQKLRQILHPHRMNHWQQFLKALTPPVVSSRHVQMTALTRSSWPTTRGTKTRQQIPYSEEHDLTNSEISSVWHWHFHLHWLQCFPTPFSQSHKTIVIQTVVKVVICLLPKTILTVSEHCNFCTRIFNASNTNFSNWHVTNIKEVLTLNQGH